MFFLIFSPTSVILPKRKSSSKPEDVAKRTLICAEIVDETDQDIDLQQKAKKQSKKLNKTKINMGNVTVSP